MKTKFAVLTLIVMVAFTGFASAAALKVGTEATFRPFEFQDEKGEFQGFDMDLIKAIAAETGTEIEIVNTAFDGLIPQLITGQLDLVIAGMTITPDRAMSVDFSEGYFNAGQVVVVAKNNASIHSYKDLAGKTAAVQIGTTGDLEASEMKGVKVARFNTLPEAFIDVFNGGADAAIADLQVAVEFIKEQPEMCKIVGDVFTEEYYGIAVAKGNKDLLNKVNAALKTLKDNGTYQAIWNKWFGTN